MRGPARGMLRGVPTWKADAIADVLLGEIAAGKFRPDEILPTEHELMERFSTSRGPIREAIKQLEVHGLVEARRKRGTVAIDPRQSTSAVVLRALVREAERKGDPKLRSDVQQIRGALLTLACMLAREKAKSADLIKLRSALARLEQAPPKGRAEALEGFWSTITTIAHNDALVLLTHWYRVAMRDVPFPTDVNLEGFARSVAWIEKAPSPSRKLASLPRILALVLGSATRRSSPRATAVSRKKA